MKHPLGVMPSRRVIHQSFAFCNFPTCGTVRSLPNVILGSRFVWIRTLQQGTIKTP